MHWGVRRYQPYPAGKTGKYLGPKQYQKQLKKNEKEVVKNEHQYKKSLALAERNERWGVDSTKHREHANEALKAINTGEANTWKLISQITDAGYSTHITQKQKIKMSNGKQFAAHFLAGVWGNLAYSLVQKDMQTVDYNKYRVTTPEDGTPKVTIEDRRKKR